MVDWRQSSGRGLRFAGPPGGDSLRWWCAPPGWPEGAWNTVAAAKPMMGFAAATVDLTQAGESLFRPSPLDGGPPRKRQRKVRNGLVSRLLRVSCLLSQPQPRSA